MTSRTSIAIFAVAIAGIAFAASRGKLMPFAAKLYSAAVSERGSRIERAVRYGPDPRQSLDLYKPSGGVKPKAIVLFFYGGGWRSGSRDIYGFVGVALAARGYAVVIPDYRLFPEVLFPAFEEDAAQAYGWTAKHVGSDGTPIFIAGHSAGAHIGALLAYDDRYRNAVDRALPRPTGFIGLSGPYAFDPRTNATTADVFRASTPGTAQPVKAVKADAPRALLVHGIDDETVGIWNTRELAAALTKQGVAARTYELEGFGHLGPLLAISRPFRWRAPILDWVAAFMDETQAGNTGHAS